MINVLMVYNDYTDEFMEELKKNVMLLINKHTVDIEVDIHILPLKLLKSEYIEKYDLIFVDNREIDDSYDVMILHMKDNNLKNKITESFDPYVIYKIITNRNKRLVHILLNIFRGERNYPI